MTVPPHPSICMLRIRPICKYNRFRGLWYMIDKLRDLGLYSPVSCISSSVLLSTLVACQLFSRITTFQSKSSKVTSLGYQLLLILASPCHLTRSLKLIKGGLTKDIYGEDSRSDRYMERFLKETTMGWPMYIF